MKYPEFNNKIVLITGGSGSWGQEFARQILSYSKPKEIRIYSRGEYRQVEMRRRFHNHPQLSFVIGDVRDKDRLSGALRGVDMVIHLAALKHVPVVEEHPWEAFLTNTAGTQNVINAATLNNVEKVLYVSSDKAVDPLNLYGITKLAAERLVVAANQAVGTKTKFITFRGGNVMGSAGSVIPIFQSQLLNENMITLTDPRMTRFFISIPEVISLALKSFKQGIGGEIFVPKMKSMTLDSLSKAMIKNLGNKNTKIKRIPVRPGEKYTELLISENESGRTREVGDLWVIMPFFSSLELEKKHSNARKVSFKKFDSASAPQFSEKEIKDLLKREGFLSKDLPKEKPYFKKGKWAFH